MGKLKRLRKKTLVAESDTEDDFSVFDDKSKPTSKPKSRPQRTALPQTKEQLALQAELADLLGDDDDDEARSRSEDSYSGASSSDDGSGSESLVDLVSTSSEEESEDEGPAPGSIFQLTAKRKGRAPRGAVGRPATKRAKARSQERRRSEGRGSSSDEDGTNIDDADAAEDGVGTRTTRSSRTQSRTRRRSRSQTRSSKGQPAPLKKKAPGRRRLRGTRAIDVDMLEEAERGHALSSGSDGDESVASIHPPQPDAPLPMGAAGVFIPPLLARHLQHHQIEGVRFMYKSVVEEGKGCVLAHCMGLGKTLQGLALIATLLDTPVVWEGGGEEEEEEEEEEEDSLGSPEKAIDMNVVELRNELRRRGVDVTKVKKKQLAEMLEQRWREEAVDKNKKRLSGNSGENDDDSGVVFDGDDEVDSGGADDHLDIAGSKKPRPRTALIVCPVNVILNWDAEFEKWLGDRAPLVYSLQEAGASNAKRAAALEEWHDTGGVMICGYDQYRNLTAPRRAQNAKHRRIFRRCLVAPGPTLLVCDEGHVLRNAQSGLSRALGDIRCRRRIVLTGTPLQNNLAEYHCMINFVRPGLLGSAHAFQRDFVRVIDNGQCEDSTAKDVRLMKQRAHVLHGLLKVCVHRADLKVLERYLPPKREYALKVQMSLLQIKLYWKYLQFSGLAVETAIGSGENGVAAVETVPQMLPQAKLFEAYTHLAKIWTHPGVLKMKRDDMGKTAASREVKAYDSIDDFVCESSDEDWSDDEEAAAKFDSKVMTGKGRKKESTGTELKDRDINKHPPDTEDRLPQWWDEIMESVSGNNEAPELSGKMLVLLQILKEAATLKEKVLLFSQSLMVLELIERVLEAGSDPGCSQRWKLGRDYFRLDGSTGSKTRQGWAQRFNDRRNRRARLFLISTKAGGLGINLASASRVIIFDAAWNPSVDSQAVFRAFRFGQTRPVFVYRLLAAGTMEEKIYHRQVTKNALASRVVDKEQKDRHFKAQELENLFSFEPEGIEEIEDGTNDSGTGVIAAQGGTVSLGSTKQPTHGCSKKFRNCTTTPPSDPVLARLLGKMQPKWLRGYVDHDALATGEGETELSPEEEAIAWAEYNAANSAQQEADAALKVVMLNANTDHHPSLKPPPNQPLSILVPSAPITANLNALTTREGQTERERRRQLLGLSPTLPTKRPVLKPRERLTEADTLNC